jgi:hypothetical protein
VRLAANAAKAQGIAAKRICQVSCRSLQNRRIGWTMTGNLFHIKDLPEDRATAPRWHAS